MLIQLPHKSLDCSNSETSMAKGGARSGPSGCLADGQTNLSLVAPEVYACPLGGIATFNGTINQ